MRNAIGIMKVAALAAVLGGPVLAQFHERHELPGSDRKNVDASGRSPKDFRVRAVHGTSPDREGATFHLITTDPYLAYQVGRNLNMREFRTVDGVLSSTPDGLAGVSNLGGPMPDGQTAKLTLQNHIGCTSCHNIPNGTVGGGMNIAKDSGFGRNTPHYFGAGLIEMLGVQIRTEILETVDTNGDGWISVPEAQAAPASLDILPHPDAAATLDFGNPRLTDDTTGTPQLNNVIRVFYVDNVGQHVPGATEVDGVFTFGYNFHVVVFGWGQGSGRDALNPTLRAFLVDAWGTHSGLQAHDPTTMTDLDGDGVSDKLSLPGAPQFPATHPVPDQGATVSGGITWGGYSLADPDGDGYATEVSEGDLDLAEWFMLNAPAPAFAGTPAEFDDGVARMDAMGCTSCHVPTWKIEGDDGTFAGDRRFFDFETSWNEAEGRLEGKVVEKFQLIGLGGDQLHVVNREEFDVAGLFSDLLHHDMGDGFAETGYDGVVNRVFRTTPLWGVGSGWPWGHDGRSLTLEDAILRHDGEGSASKAAYLAASPADQEALVEFLRKLQLYDVEQLPADIDGDGVISSNHVVEGKLTGPERFNAEWKFDDPLQIQGTFVNEDGEVSFSWAGTNITQAYKLELQYREDRDEEDGDGWPDEWDDAPLVKGWYDGVNNPPWWQDPINGKP